MKRLLSMWGFGVTFAGDRNLGIALRRRKPDASAMVPPLRLELRTSGSTNRRPYFVSHLY
jgi:hypothetical protein